MKKKEIKKRNKTQIERDRILHLSGQIMQRNLRAYMELAK